MTKQEKAEQLAARMIVIFTFCAELFPDIDLLEEAVETTKKNADKSVSAAAVLGAMNVDYQEREMEWNLRFERAEALLNLIKTLKQTETDRKKYRDNQAKYKDIVKIFGL